MRRHPPVENLEPRLLLASWYVSTNGSDATGTGASTNPWRTIGKAATVVQAGDVVNVAPGAYSEKLTLTRSGTAAAPIQFVKWGTGAVTVTSPTAVPVGEATIRVAASHVIIDGIDVGDSGWYGYNVEGTAAAGLTNVTIRNVATTNTAASGIRGAYVSNLVISSNKILNACIGPDPSWNVQECITVAEVDGFIISGNEIWNSIGGVSPSNGGEGIDAKGSSRNGMIVDNFVHDLYVNRRGIYLDSGSKQGTGPEDDVPMSNITVTRNIIRNAQGGVAIASELGGTVSGVVVSNNVIFNNTEDGIVIAGWLRDGPRRDILIVNNTVYNNGYGNASPTWGGGIDIHSSNIQNIRIRNNVVSQNESWQIANTARAPDSEITVSNNVYFGTALPLWNPLTGADGLNADPLFVDPANRNLRLRATSPAINFGSWIEAPTVDRFNLPRYGLPDAGAYEYIPPSPAGVTLAPASDTGTPGDNKTRLNNADPASKLTFTVSGTVVGATVSVFAGQTRIGTATATGATTAITTDGATVLPDGQSAVTATQSLAGATSGVSPALSIAIDATAPQLAGTPVINRGSPQPGQRSQVRTITWTFTEPLQIEPAHFRLINRDTQVEMSLSSRSLIVSGVEATIHLDRADADTSPRLFLADANYELSLDPTVADDAGNALIPSGVGRMGTTASFRFHKLLGDFNGDRRVSNADYLLWKQFFNRNIGSAVDTCFDLNASGRVSNADYLIWKACFNRRLALLPDGLTFI